jgi:adenylyl-sulfate kinase
MQKNIRKEYSKVQDIRHELLGQKGCVLWFTGLSGSGKSTIAYELELKLFKNSHLCYVLDGDNVRYGLNSDLGFSIEDRQENIRRVAEVANLFADAGMITIVSFISPFKSEREFAKKLIGKENFFEIYFSTPISLCEKRDAKGLYKKVRNGEIKEFTGISSPYENPENPNLEINTLDVNITESVNKLYNLILTNKIIKTNSVKKESNPSPQPPAPNP